jgi:hypothetical protein
MMPKKPASVCRVLSDRPSASSTASRPKRVVNLMCWCLHPLGRGCAATSRPPPTPCSVALGALRVAGRRWFRRVGSGFFALLEFSRVNGRSSLPLLSPSSRDLGEIVQMHRSQQSRRAPPTAHAPRHMPLLGVIDGSHVSRILREFWRSPARYVGVYGPNSSWRKLCVPQVDDTGNGDQPTSSDASDQVKSSANAGLTEEPRRMSMLRMQLCWPLANATMLKSRPCRARRVLPKQCLDAPSIFGDWIGQHYSRGRTTLTSSFVLVAVDSKRLSVKLGAI